MTSFRQQLVKFIRHYSVNYTGHFVVASQQSTMDVSDPPLLANRPPAIVIGAGIAGLATALRLATGGMQVTLLERHAHAGGKIRTVPSAAGPVDAGPTVLTLRHVFDDLFENAGAQLEDHVTLIPQDVLARHVWPDGTTLNLHADTQTSTDAIAAFAGTAAADEFRAFNNRTARLYRAFDAPMMQAGTPKIGRLVARVIKDPSLMSALAPLSTLSTSLQRHFSDPRLAQLFGRYATYVGGAPHLSPAVLSLIWQAEATGVWVVKGGMHKLAEALRRLAIDRGVDIRLGTHVDRIILKDGKAHAVETNGSEHLEAEAIVYAGDPRALAVGALGNALKVVAPQTAKLPRSFSARVHSFAAVPQGRDLAHHNVFFAQDPLSEFRDLAAGQIPRDPTLYLCAEDRGQGTNPPQCERFEIIANAPATDTLASSGDLNTWHHQIMQRMAAMGVIFTPQPTPATITTPQQFAAMFPHSQGALYGQSPHGLTAALGRPTAITPIPGLWLAGGGAHPGAGIPMATLSARHAAEAILNGQISTSRSGQTATPGGTLTA